MQFWQSICGISGFWWEISIPEKLSLLVFWVESVRIDLIWNVNYSFFFFFSSLPWSQPFEGNFEVRLFPLSLFYLLEVNEQHKGRGHSLPVPKLPENILVLSFQFVMGVFKNYVLICPVWAVCSVSLCLFFDLLGVSLLNLQKVLWVTDEDPHINLHLQSFILEVFQSNGCMCLLLSRIPSALITQ